MRSTAAVLVNQALANGGPLSRLRRRQRNLDYADVRVIPTMNGKPLWDKGNGLSRST